MSSALPIVRSIFPPLNLSTSSRSARLRPPPAYVTGIVQVLDKWPTSAPSMPACLPSTSAAWMRNSLQYGSRRAMFSSNRPCQQDCRSTGRLLARCLLLPFVMAKSVMVCHLSIATRHPFSTRRQLRSITSLLVLPSKALSTDCNLSRENVPDGKRKDVMMTYHPDTKSQLQIRPPSTFHHAYTPSQHQRPPTPLHSNL